MNSTKYSSLLYCISVIVVVVTLFATMTCSFITIALFLNAGRYGIYLAYAGSYGFATLAFYYYATKTYEKGRVKKDLTEFLWSLEFVWLCYILIATVVLCATVALWTFTWKYFVSERYVISFVTAVLSLWISGICIVLIGALIGNYVWQREGGSDPLRYLSD
jgi:hypothetical protein